MLSFRAERLDGGGGVLPCNMHMALNLICSVHRLALLLLTNNCTTVSELGLLELTVNC